MNLISTTYSICTMPMNTLLPFLCISIFPRAHVQCVTFKQAHIDMQHDAMRQLLGMNDLPDEARALQEMKLIWQRASADDVCSWSGVSCRKTKKMGKIEWTNFHHLPLLDFDWFPNTLTSIMIYNKRSKGELNTRRLPQELTEAHLERCGIIFSVDLSTLPPRLRVLNLCKNHIQGTAYFDNLPAQMQLIDLSSNVLSTVVVCNAKLPVSLKKAEFGNNSKRRVRIVCTDGEVVGPRVVS